MGKRWTDEEQILALNLYFKLPFGQQHSGKERVQELAELLGRTPGSINMKLNNYAALDPTLDREGLSNTSNKDENTWNRFWKNLDELGAASEFILEKIDEQELNETLKRSEVEELLAEKSEEYGTEARTDQKRRAGQHFFRRVVLSNYEYQCCVCRLRQKSLLEAAHIIDWSETNDPNTRVDPRNGLEMCSIHHKAFDQRIITIDPTEKIVHLSEDVRSEDTPGAESIFHTFADQEIHVPEKFGPERYLRKEAS